MLEHLEHWLGQAPALAGLSDGMASHLNMVIREVMADALAGGRELHEVAERTAAAAAHALHRAAGRLAADQAAAQAQIDAFRNRLERTVEGALQTAWGEAKRAGAAGLETSPEVLHRALDLIEVSGQLNDPREFLDAWAGEPDVRVPRPEGQRGQFSEAKRFAMGAGLLLGSMGAAHLIPPSVGRPEAVLAAAAAGFSGLGGMLLFSTEKLSESALWHPVETGRRLKWQFLKFGRGTLSAVDYIRDKGDARDRHAGLTAPRRLPWATQAKIAGAAAVTGVAIAGSMVYMHHHLMPHFHHALTVLEREVHAHERLQSFAAGSRMLMDLSAACTGYSALTSFKSHSAKWTHQASGTGMGRVGAFGLSSAWLVSGLAGGHDATRRLYRAGQQVARRIGVHLSAAARRIDQMHHTAVNKARGLAHTARRRPIGLQALRKGSAVAAGDAQPPPVQDPPERTGSVPMNDSSDSDVLKTRFVSPDGRMFVRSTALEWSDGEDYYAADGEGYPLGPDDERLAGDFAAEGPTVHITLTNSETGETWEHQVPVLVRDNVVTIGAGRLPSRPGIEIQTPPGGFGTYDDAQLCELIEYAVHEGQERAGRTDLTDMSLEEEEQPIIELAWRLEAHPTEFALLDLPAHDELDPQMDQDLGPGQ